MNPTKIIIQYDDDNDEIIAIVNKALNLAGLHVQFVCDELEHDGFNIYELKEHPENT